MELLSPAKINLFLQIIGKRPDGYHNLVSLMCAIRLSDTISLTPGTDTISVACRAPDVPEDETNLAYMAADRFLKALGTREGVRISIEKRIPVAAGLGGGSSNAATVIRGLNDHYGHPFPDEKLCSIGLTIGADVPFFIRRRPAIARGIGERLEPYDGLRAAPLVLIFPGFHVSTASAYNNLNLGLTKCKKTITCTLLKRQGFRAEKHLCNDLEAVTVSRYPVITSAKETLMHSGATGALMSGSGPAVFGVFPDSDTARKAYQVIQENRKWQVFLSEIWTDP